MSKKKKRRTVGLGSIPGAAPTQQPAEQSARPAAQPSVPPSAPPAKQPPAKQSAVKVKTRAVRSTPARSAARAGGEASDSQLELTRRRNYFGRWFDAMNDFWFTPRSPRILGVIRILTGVLLLYSLAVWTLELSTFFATDGLLPSSYRGSNGLWFAWSHLDWFEHWSRLWVGPNSCIFMHVLRDR